MKTILESTKNAKRIFDLCDNLGEGVFGKLHILFSSDDDRFGSEETKVSFRVYHADGYCFDVSREPYEADEGEINDSAIGGFEYHFMEGVYEGFKELTEEQAINLLQRHE